MVSGEAAPDGSDWAPCQITVLDGEVCDACIRKGHIEGGKQLCCVSQADARLEGVQRNLVPVHTDASSACCTEQNDLARNLQKSPKSAMHMTVMSNSILAALFVPS